MTVDGDVVGPFEHVDADDVAVHAPMQATSLSVEVGSHRTDARPAEGSLTGSMVWLMI